MATHASSPSSFWRVSVWLVSLTSGVAAGFAWIGARAEPTLSWGLDLTLATAVALGAVVAIARKLHPPATGWRFTATLPQAHPGVALDAPRPAEEIRDINAGLQRIAREIARAEHDRALMLAGISHDLRTPLARLRLEAEMSVTNAEALRHMAEDIEQLDRLIDQFISYARRVEPRAVDIALLAATERAVAPFVASGALVVDLHVPAGLSVSADPVELERVLQNLLQNAERYAKPAQGGPATVSIDARASQGGVVLQVRDHGPGVAEEQLDRLATPFFRGDHARTAAGGAGLGLAIVQRTVSLLGGSMRLSNAAGGGLCVEIRLRPAGQPQPGP
jgi:two-component system osmolarity sensor histidine kinase EnvZ